MSRYSPTPARPSRVSSRAIRTKLSWLFFSPFRWALSVPFKFSCLQRGIFRMGPLVILEVLSTRFRQDMPLFSSNLTGLPSLASRIIHQKNDEMRIKLTSNAGSGLLFVLDGSRREDLFQEIVRSKENIVVIAGSDRTFPVQTDLRYPTGLVDSSDAGSFWEGTNKTIFVENLDLTVENLSALPGGVMPNSVTGSVRFTFNKVFSPEPRSQNFAFMSGRTRSGPQWETRKQAAQIARDHWSDFVYIAKGDIPPAEWRRIARKHTFGFCVEGGGLSPSPKFFDLLLARTIPIIRESSISEVHAELPCVIVSDWQANSLSREFLEEEYQRVKSAWSDWEQVFERLTLRFWWDFIHKNNHER